MGGGSSGIVERWSFPPSDRWMFNVDRVPTTKQGLAGVGGALHDDHIVMWAIFFRSG